MKNHTFPALKSAATALTALLLCSCGDGDATQKQFSVYKEAFAKVNERLKTVEAENEALKSSLGGMEGKINDAVAKASAVKGGLPEFLDKETIASSFESMAMAKRDQIKKVLASEGMEVNTWGEPVITMPEQLQYPYKVDIRLAVTQNGAQRSLPLSIRADWDGKWQELSEKEMLAQLKKASALPTPADVTPQPGPSPATPVAKPKPPPVQPSNPFGTGNVIQVPPVDFNEPKSP
jgi:hypothetical protein